MNFNPIAESDKIITFIRETFIKTHKSTAVIGLSGGIDSAVAFALTLKALGPDKIHAFYLPAKSSSPQNLIDIQTLTSDFELKTSHFHLIPIKSIIQKSWRIINKDKACRRKDFLTQGSEGSRVEKKIYVERDKLRLANLSARIRMMILFDQAKKHDALVIGTENKSETMLGYFTRFGDQASDLEPIAHLFKTQVINLAKHLNIPESIIDKPPSADLWPGQTDEIELGFSYQAADPILMQLTAGEHPKGELADKIVALVDRMAFKHRVPYLLDK